MVDTFAVSTRLAAMLLLSKAQITLGEIEALPFVEGRQEAYVIARRLVRLFSPPYQIEVDSVIRESDIKLRLASTRASIGPAGR